MSPGTKRIQSRSRYTACLALAAWLLAAAGPLPRHPVMVYHESWWERAGSTGGALSLAAIPRTVDIVALGFAKPDLAYHGGLALGGTGLEYVAPGAAVRDAVTALRAGNPGVRVLLSVGGASYTGWDRLDPAGVARLVRDLGLDGVDVDYEPPDPRCRPGPACASDAMWQDVVRRLRAVLPRPALLSVAGWSVGAYGQGRWTDARPPSPWAGSMVALLRSPAASLIDLVAIDAYGAGPSYDPGEAFAAYRSLWSGPLLLGLEGPPATGGGPPATPAEAARRARLAARDPAGGAMVYSWLGHPADEALPAGQALAAAACRAVGNPC